MTSDTRAFRALGSRTLPELLMERAGEDPEGVPYVYLQHGDGETTEERMTFADLDRRARALASRLNEVARAGDTALLLYAPGLQFAVGLYGCLYAGLVPVPAYPPDPFRLERSVPRLQAIVDDAGATVVLTDASIALMRDGMVANSPALGLLHWLTSDAPGDDTWSAIPDRATRPDDLALIQYTSGSTGSPRGVLLSHANILRYISMMEASDPESLDGGERGLIWLPTYHDLGLIQGIVSPITLRQQPLVLMSPIAFLQRPLRWLEAISQYRATLSGGPNFAFDLCCDKVSEAERRHLDLSSWRIAFLGAEPIRPRTLSRFVEHFGPCGFAPTAFRTAYGLAEATLTVSLGTRRAAPTIRRIDSDRLAHGVASDSDGPGNTELVGCGQPLVGMEVRIVDPATSRACRPNVVGEVWVRSPSVAQGYWRRPAETEATFGARLEPSNTGPFLRTGDLGFMDETGELFVTGRVKDVLILRGRNVYPQDIEACAEGCHPDLRRGCVAAFSVNEDGVDRAVVVQELRSGSTTDPSEIVRTIRKTVSETVGVRLHAVVLIAAQTIPKTSSGKIQRSACRAAFLSGRLKEAARWNEAPRVLATHAAI